MRLFHSKNSYDVTPLGGTSGTYNPASSSTQANESRQAPVSRPALSNSSMPDAKEVTTVERKSENVCNLFFK